MPFSGKRKHPYRFTVYVPPEKEGMVKDFIRAFQARNESASQKIIDYIEELMSNGKINPQTRLDNNKILYCVFKDRRKAEHTALHENSGKKHRVCSVHADCILHNRLRRNYKYKGWSLVD